jgi:hypothetical protein
MKTILGLLVTLVLANTVLAQSSVEFIPTTADAFNKFQAERYSKAPIENLETILRSEARGKDFRADGMPLSSRRYGEGISLEYARLSPIFMRGMMIKAEVLKQSGGTVVFYYDAAEFKPVERKEHIVLALGPETWGDTLVKVTVLLKSKDCNTIYQYTPPTI